MILKMSDAKPLLGPLDVASKEYSAAISALHAFGERGGQDGSELTAIIERMNEAGERFRAVMRQLEDLSVG